MTAIFITATGTDIGKTFVAAGLIRHFRAAGQPVEALKPVVTGFDPAAAADSDPGVLLAALGRPVTPEEIERISPYRFSAPLVPDMAARKENRTLDFDALVDFSRRAVAAHSGTLLIEGVGGIMVPLDRRHTVLDWIAALHLPIVLLAGSYLGSISHTLTCLDVLRRCKLVIKALIVNETPHSTVPIIEAMETLGCFARPTPIVSMSHQRAGTGEHVAFGRIAELL